MKRSVFAAVFTLSALTACGGEQVVVVADSDPLLENLGPAAGVNARAEFIDPDGKIIGQASMTDSANGVLIRVDLKDLPQGWHGLHLHQTGDCSGGESGFTASGGHINPDGNAHGFLNDEGYQRADMPNVYVGSDGRATAAFFNSYVRLNPGEETAATVGFGAILLDTDGFAMIVHENADDHVSQPVGGAGSRIGCAAFN